MTLHDKGADFDTRRDVHPLRTSVSRAVQQKGRGGRVAADPSAARTLSDYPNVGTPVMAQGDVRRFVTPPYIVDYEIHPTELVILLIHHGRQDISLVIDGE